MNEIDIIAKQREEINAAAAALESATAMILSLETEMALAAERYNAVITTERDLRAGALAELKSDMETRFGAIEKSLRELLGREVQNVVVPPPKDPDLGPVTSALSRLEKMVGQMMLAEEVPKEEEFTVRRDGVGKLRKVEGEGMSFEFIPGGDGKTTKIKVRR